MGLYIIHLTDVHIRGIGDKILAKADQLAQVCSNAIKGCSDVLLIVTGDLSFSGKKEQFTAFHSLVDAIVSRVSVLEDVRSVRVFTVPGNHDCDFEEENGVRTTLLSTISVRDVNGFNSDCVKHIAQAVQTEYLLYSASHNQGLSKDEYLCVGQTVDTTVGKVLILQFNTAWQSRLHETAGNLCMPINLLPSIDSSSNDLVIAAMHHPTNWLHPDNKIAFEGLLRPSIDLLLCGHEHYEDSVTQIGDTWNYKVLEGRELQQSSNDDHSGFAIYYLDDTLTTISIEHFEWKDNAYTLNGAKTIPFARNQSNSQAVLFPNNATLEEINDIGLILHHPNKADLTLRDIFVWPQLEAIQANKSVMETIVDCDKLPEVFLNNPISLIHGEEASGKSTLAKRLYLSYVENGLCCVKSSGRSFTARKEAGIRKEVESLFVEQYDNNQLELFNATPASKKVLIIDDFEQIVYSNDRLDTVFSALREMFSNIILLSANEENVAILLTRASMKDVVSYRIKHFGNRKRAELIEKWYALGEENVLLPVEEMDAITQRATLAIENIIGTSSAMMPATPLTILSLLQMIDNTGAAIVRGNSYAYERLVQVSLERLSAGQQAYQNIYTSILSLLSYTMLQTKKWTVSDDDLLYLVKTFINKGMLPLNNVTVINRLVESKILVCSGQKHYSFRYPYLYYYFCGLYISKNLMKDDVQKQIEYMNSRLHVVEYGNIMIFVCHFINNEDILLQILYYAVSIFDNVKPFDFSKPHTLLDEVFGDVAKLLDQAFIGNEEDVSQLRRQEQIARDQHQINDGSVPERTSDEIEDSTIDANSLTNVIGAIRVIDVLGQILRNYPGDFSGEQKTETIEEIKALAMRVVGIVYDSFAGFKEELIEMLINQMREENPDVSDNDITQSIRRLFSTLVFSVAYSMIQKASISIASPLLLPVLNGMVESNPNDYAIALIKCNTDLLCQTSPNYDKIIGLNQLLIDDGNIYAQETLRMAVANHLRRRHCGTSMRDRLCAEFNLRKADVVPNLPSG